MTYQEALEQFVACLQSVSDAHYAAHFMNLTPPSFELETTGRKFDRVYLRNHCQVSAGQRSIVAFIAKKAGNTKSLGPVEVGSVLKPATYLQPAKHVRGSIFGETREELGLSSDGLHVAYLR